MPLKILENLRLNIPISSLCTCKTRQIFLIMETKEVVIEKKNNVTISRDMKRKIHKNKKRIAFSHTSSIVSCLFFKRIVGEFFEQQMSQRRSYASIDHVKAKLTVLDNEKRCYVIAEANKFRNMTSSKHSTGEILSYGILVF